MSTAKITKLDRPPAAQNWVRYNHPDILKTASSVANFVLGVPVISFQTGLKIVKDRIELGIDQETAVNAVRRSGNSASRPHNESFVKAFFEYDEIRQYSGHKSFDDFREFFRISRDILVPCKPTSVILEDGHLVPIFVCGWTTVPLTLFQRRLLMTVYQDAVFSLTDFQNSPAEVLFFPKDKTQPNSKRVPEVWKRGDYDLLTDNELREQIDIFMQAREIAKKLVEERLTTNADKPKHGEGLGRDERSGDQGDLFSE